MSTRTVLRTAPPAAIGAILVASALVFAPAAAAQTAGPDAQDRVDEVLADYPGGTQISPNEVAWDDGAVVLTIEDASAVSARSVGSCATGAHCVYSGTGLSGSKLTFWSCTTQSVAPLGSPVRSIANARSSVTVREYNSVGVIGSVAANSWANAPSGVTKVGC